MQTSQATTSHCIRHGARPLHSAMGFNADLLHTQLETRPNREIATLRRPTQSQVLVLCVAGQLWAQSARLPVHHHHHHHVLMSGHNECCVSTDIVTLQARVLCKAACCQALTHNRHQRPAAPGTSAPPAFVGNVLHWGSVPTSMICRAVTLVMTGRLQGRHSVLCTHNLRALCADMPLRARWVGVRRAGGGVGGWVGGVCDRDLSRWRMKGRGRECVCLFCLFWPTHLGDTSLSG